LGIDDNIFHRNFDNSIDVFPLTSLIQNDKQIFFSQVHSAGGKLPKVRTVTLFVAFFQMEQHEIDEKMISSNFQ
jgi:hypothetical protein